MPHSIFAENITSNMGAERVPSDITTLQTPEGTQLSIRNRGCFVTDFSMVDPTTGERVNILYNPDDIEIPKLTASHIMSPAGPSDGIGGQHGYARWADYHEFTQDNDQLTSFQAKRSDMGPGVSKFFELADEMLATSTTLTNYESTDVETSIGEHLYFALEDESTDGLLIGGQTIDQKFGEGTEKSIMEGNAFFWAEYSGSVTVNFPAGRIVMISADTEPKLHTPKLGMLIWHKPGTESVCFEPTLGFVSGDQNTELTIPPHESVSLITYIDVEIHQSASEKKFVDDWTKRLSTK